jgi:hypothetical protein
MHGLHCIGEIALAPLVESNRLLFEKWWGIGKAYLFIAQTGRYLGAPH